MAEAWRYGGTYESKQHYSLFFELNLSCCSVSLLGCKLLVLRCFMFASVGEAIKFRRMWPSARFGVFNAVFDFVGDMQF